jgi:branched-chain amino acid transport system ATP-binding protein
MTSDPSAAAVALEVRDLSVAYGKVEALHHASLKVPAGAIVTVIGPNGAGKTTMLNAVMGLLPARGEVRYEGTPIAKVEVEARVAHGLCLVPERRELFAEMTVADNLTLGAFPRHRRRERGIGADLEAVYARFPRLRERSEQLAGTLSGGRCSRSAAR